MSWCDKLASIPSVGVWLEPHYVSGDSLLTALAPLLDRWSDTKKEKALFQISRHESFAVGFNTEDGFNYTIEPGRCVVEFKHRMRFKQTSGGPPIAEMLSQPLPYTALLPELSKRLLETITVLPSQKGRGILRIGVVATTVVSEAELPPGLRRLIQYVGRPWKGPSDALTFQVVGALGEAKGRKDRCVHTFNKPENEELVTLSLDWQRRLDPALEVGSAAFQSSFKNAQEEALKYFEDVAEGNRFDEDLLRATT